MLTLSRYLRNVLSLPVIKWYMYIINLISVSFLPDGIMNVMGNYPSIY